MNVFTVRGKRTIVYREQKSDNCLEGLKVFTCTEGLHSDFACVLNGNLCLVTLC